jgi:hypothetical protein
VDINTSVMGGNTQNQRFDNAANSSVTHRLLAITDGLVRMRYKEVMEANESLRMQQYLLAHCSLLHLRYDHATSALPQKQQTGNTDDREGE